MKHLFFLFFCISFFFSCNNKRSKNETSEKTDSSVVSKSVVKDTLIKYDSSKQDFRLIVMDTFPTFKKNKRVVLNKNINTLFIKHKIEEHFNNEKEKIGVQSGNENAPSQN